MKYISYLSLFPALLFLFNFAADIHAAGAIPRTDLRLELALATGSQDTSGNGRIVSSTGVAPSYQVDPVYGVPYAQFSGNGGLKVNTSWASTTDNFTVSFWMKHAGNFLTGATSITGATNQIRIANAYSVPSDFRNDTYSSILTQNIFTSDTAGGIKLLMDSTGKCSLRGGPATVTLQNINIGQLWDGYKWTPLYQNDYRVIDSGNNMQESFNCSQLVDNKWHNIVIIRRSATSTSFYIDGIEVSKITTGAFSIGRSFTFGYSSTDMNYYSGKLSSSQIDTITNSKYLRGNLAGFRLYSRSLSDDELEAIFDEYRYAQSDLAGAGSIQIAMEKYTKPNLSIRLKNILPNLSKENVTYEYSTDTINFNPISDITDLSISTGSLDYKVGIDLSGKPDGRITINLRVRGSNGSFQNIGTISFVKSDIIPVITINAPSSLIESAKTITAFASGAASLYMYITTSETCDSSVSSGLFEDYSDLTFTNAGDNGKRVCYKAIFTSTNKTIYKLSPIIQGIKATDAIVSDPNATLFGNYTLWTKSKYLKQNDNTFGLLDLLVVNTSQSQGTINGITMTDINGDGLVDFLYAYYFAGTKTRNGSLVNFNSTKRAIIVNNGNYTFKLAYKCVSDTESDPIYNFYYGDCADTTR